MFAHMCVIGAILMHTGNWFKKDQLYVS